MVYKYGSIILRIVFAALFVISAYTKLADIQTFAQALNSYDILPPKLVPLFTYYVPLLELGLAVGFIIPGFEKINTLLTIGLMVVFQIALTSLIVRGIDVDCGCFGRFATSPLAALVRNFVILGLCGLLLFSLSKNKKLQNSNDVEFESSENCD